MRPWLEKLPAALVALRFGLALLLMIDSLDHQTSLGFVVAYGVAIASDILDGIVARRLGVSTPLCGRPIAGRIGRFFLPLPLASGGYFPRSS